MESIRNRRTSASVILVVVALIVAAAGSAIAAGQSNAGQSSSDSAAAALTKKQVKKIANKQAKKQIKKAAPTLSVAHATTANSATTAGSATTATTATTAANANLLNGFAASDLARTTTASAGNLTNPCSTAILDNFGSATFTNTVTKAVTAPKAGVLLVLGTVVAERDISSPAASELRLRSRITVDGVQAAGVVEGVLDDAPALSCADATTLTLQSAVPVTAGNHAVNVQAAVADGLGLAYVGYSNVTTVFVPFGNAGTQGVVGSTSSGSQGFASNN